MECAYDVIDYASQVGRLDIVSLALAAIGIGLIVQGIIFFIRIPKVASAEAREEARKVAIEEVRNYLKIREQDIDASSHRGQMLQNRGDTSVETGESKETKKEL